MSEDWKEREERKRDKRIRKESGYFALMRLELW